MVALDNTTLNGQSADIMKPLPDKIRELRDQIFTTGGAINPLANQNDLPGLMQADGARVRVLMVLLRQGWIQPPVIFLSLKVCRLLKLGQQKQQMRRC